MSFEDSDRSPSAPAPSADVIHRRWVLSKRAADGRPQLVREDRVVHPSGFTTRGRRPSAAETRSATTSNVRSSAALT